MRILLGLILVLFMTPNAFAQMEYQWRTCEQDSDCVIIGGGCCMEAVNKSFKEQGQAYCDDFNSRARCVRALDPAKATMKCQKTPVPCLDGSADSCLSKKAKCVLSETDEDHSLN